MRWVFWCSIGYLNCTYLGYPMWLYVRGRLRSRPIHAREIFPQISIVMAVYNEERVLAQKLDNLAGLDYPSDRCEVIVVSDGSTDGTNQLLATRPNGRLRVIILPEHRGKWSALNRGIGAARGEIVVFTDARQLIAPDAAKRLVANFADPSVGCVSGELMLGEFNRTASGTGVGLYWNIEKKVRQLESAAGSVVGATGALYAARRALLATLPPATILDDVYLPLSVAREGKRVVFEPQARVYDSTADGRHEFRRRVRTLTGNYQLLQIAPWLLTGANPLWFEFVCHKLLRLLVPFALAAVLVSSLYVPGTIYELALVFQVIFYGLAALAAFRSNLSIVERMADVALMFVILNTAAVVALVYFVTGRREVWSR
jgi:poly-beta-1,6-N-acetyl-D-glucosamine synthase